MAESNAKPEAVPTLDLFTDTNQIISVHPWEPSYTTYMAHYQNNPGEFKVTYCEQEGITAYFFMPSGFQLMEMVWQFRWVGVHELEKLLLTTFVDWSSRLFVCPRVSTRDPLPFPNHWQVAEFGCKCGI